jgi:hypothetical protein
MRADEGRAAKERDLVRLYMDLTGASEAIARGVLMYVCSPATTQDDLVDKADLSAWELSDASRAEPAANSAARNGNTKQLSFSLPSRGAGRGCPQPQQPRYFVCPKTVLSRDVSNRLVEDIRGPPGLNL